jgi:transposase-like protein
MRTPELLSDPVYHDEDASRAYLEAARWPEYVSCPLCGSVEKITKLGGPSMGPGWWYCGACQDKFTVRVGTVMERSHIPLHKWLLAFRLMASSKKGISAHQLHRTLGITYKSAWFLAHRIREAMRPIDPEPLGGEGKTIEADETYFSKLPSTTTWKFSNETGWRKETERFPADKPRTVKKVMALVERGGAARAEAVDDTTSATLRAVLRRNASTKSVLMTDEWQAYRRPGREFAGHLTVNHSAEEWVRGEAHTNTIEGYFSIFKRGMKGVYQHCSETHLQRYLDEFSFRYSYRVKLGVDDSARTGIAIQGAEGKRLTYRRTRGQEAADEIPF